MANIFSNFGNKVGNAFTNLGQGGNLFNANPATIASLSDEDKKRFKQEGLQKFANSLGVAAAIGSGDPQRVALAQNKIRQDKIDKEDAERKAEQDKLIASMSPEQQKIFKTFGPTAAFNYQQNLQSGEMAGMAEQRKIQSLIGAGYTAEQANAIVVGGLKPEDVQGLNQPIGQNIIDESNEIVETLSKDTGMQNDYANLDLSLIHISEPTRPY